METSLAKPIARLALLQNGRLIYFLVAIVFKSFLRIVRSVSSLLKNQHFQIPIRSGKTARTKTSLYRADVAFSINLLIYLTLQLQGEKYKIIQYFSGIRFSLLSLLDVTQSFSQRD